MKANDNSTRHIPARSGNYLSFCITEVAFAFRSFAGRVRHLAMRLLSPRVRKTDAGTAWYRDLYRELGERALHANRVGDTLPELSVHDLNGQLLPLKRSWKEKPTLLVTMSLSCGQTRRHALAIERISRRFRSVIQTAIIYVVEAHPNDTASPYTEHVWVTALNEIDRIRCNQTRTVSERIRFARELKQRFRLSSTILIDPMDNPVWQAFGRAPNVAILMDSNGRIVARQGWFEPTEMSREIVSLVERLRSRD